MVVVYGINNCDSVKKAKKWLDQNKVDYRFHDIRKQPLEKAQIKQWVDQLGWASVINKRSTSWKQLSQPERESMDSPGAVQAIIEQPTLFKRPLITQDHSVIVTGFDAKAFEKIFLN